MTTPGSWPWRVGMPSRQRNCRTRAGRSMWADRDGRVRLELNEFEAGLGRAPAGQQPPEERQWRHCSPARIHCLDKAAGFLIAKTLIHLARRAIGRVNAEDNDFTVAEQVLR